MKKTLNKCRAIGEILVFRIKCILKRRNDAPLFFLINTPTHGNLGDHAIAISEIDWLKLNFPKNKIVEISDSLIRRNIKFIKKSIRNEDILFFTGGGYFGNIWMGEEMMARNVFASFPNNKVIVLPQTFYYEESNEGEATKNDSFNVFSHHIGKVLMCARELYSYDLISKEMGADNCFLATDFVTLLQFQKSYDRKKQILICLRSDIEKNISEIDFNSIHRLFPDMEIKHTDTVLHGKNHFSYLRKKEVEEKLEEFATSKFVITDRLHGMIFSAITGTPCIVLSGKSFKTKGVYEMLSNIPYILFRDSSEKNMDTALKEVSAFFDVKCVFDNTKVKQTFDNMADVVRRVINES